MTTPPTPEPSAEALAAYTKVSQLINVFLFTPDVRSKTEAELNSEGAHIIDTEFAALREENKDLRGKVKWAEADISDLRARLEQAEEDSKRLDWLQRKDALLDSDDGGMDGPSEYRVVYLTGNRNDLTAHDFTGQTVRDAIDAAMSAPSAKPGEGQK